MEVVILDDFRVACSNGLYDKVQEGIAQGIDINKVDDKAWTPLVFAVRGKHLNIVKLLIRHGANVNAETNFGTTPLMIAVMNGLIDIARELIKNGAEVNHLNSSLESPLSQAITKENVNMITFLLLCGAEITERVILRAENHRMKDLLLNWNKQGEDEI